MSNWVVIEKLTPLGEKKWSGEAQFSYKRFPVKLLIYEYSGQIRAVNRLCPHQSYDMAQSNLEEGWLIQCPSHGMKISLLDDKHSYEVKKEEDTFYCFDHK